MKLTCPHCSNELKIKEDEVYAETDQQIKCPGCNKNIQFNSLIKKEKFLKKINTLPPVPKILIKAREVMSDETKSLHDLAEILEKDQAMTARVLKIANSAYYSLRKPVNSVKQACSILGAEILIQMITLASTSKLLGNELKGYSVSSGEVFSHSVETAFASRLIAEKTNPLLSVDAFSAGVLHDSGKLILNSYLIQNKELFDKKVSEGKKIYAAEKEIFGFDHAEIGNLFLVKSNIPIIQSRAVLWHHQPSKSNNDPLAYIVHLADGLMNMTMDMRAAENLEVEPGTIQFLGISTEFLESVREETKIAMELLFDGFI